MKNKKFIIVIFLFLLSCYEGYISSENANVLKKYLEPAKLKELIENPDPNILIIDVRPEASYLNGHIPKALSYPSATIKERLSEIPKDKYIILYCETGGRAQAVIKFLEQNGYSLLMNWGGVGRWPYELEK